MKRAQAALEQAKKSPDNLPAAIAAEQAAYQALLKATPREFRIQRSRNGAQNQGNSSGQPNQRQFDQLEMANEQNRYETERQAADGEQGRRIGRSGLWENDDVDIVVTPQVLEQRSAAQRPASGHRVGRFGRQEKSGGSRSHGDVHSPQRRGGAEVSAEKRKCQNKPILRSEISTLFSPRFLRVSASLR